MEQSRPGYCLRQLRHGEILGTVGSISGVGLAGSVFEEGGFLCDFSWKVILFICLFVIVSSLLGKRQKLKPHRVQMRNMFWLKSYNKGLEK